MELTGLEAIAFAELKGIELAKYAFPGPAMYGLSPEQARKIATNDPELIHISPRIILTRIPRLDLGMMEFTAYCETCKMQVGCGAGSGSHHTCGVEDSESLVSYSPLMIVEGDTPPPRWG